MKFYNIENAARFMDVVRGCEGPVYLVSDGGRRMNLKELAQHASLLREMGVSLGGIGDAGIEVIAERGTDANRLFRFMAEAARVA